MELLVLLKLHFFPRISNLVLRHRCQGAQVLLSITQGRSLLYSLTKRAGGGRDMSALGSGMHVKALSMTAQ